MKVKGESEKAGLKLNVQKTKKGKSPRKYNKGTSKDQSENFR